VNVVDVMLTDDQDNNLS